MRAAAAPSNGAAVQLASSNYAVALVFAGNGEVNAGATASTFSITTPAVAFIQTATITATYNGTTQTAVITVVPPNTPLAPTSSCHTLPSATSSPPITSCAVIGPSRVAASAAPAG